MALKTDGTMWSWGRNPYGQLGLGEWGSKDVPTQVGVASDWESVTAGGNHALAIKTDGTLWAWGYNLAGQLGLGDATTRNSPAKIGAETSWALVSAGENHTLAKKDDGTVWAWGDNVYGCLGLGDDTDRNSPTQVGSGSSWAELSAGGSHTLGVKADGTLWVWGSNISGRLGLGDFVDRSVPVLRNILPKLGWTGESNYTSDGINPAAGRPGGTFVFRVKYADSDNDDPAAGYPRVYIKKNGTNISGSPFSMALISSVTYTAGAVYSYSQVLSSTGTDYTYSFEAEDSYNALSTGTPVVVMSGPSVTNSAPVLAWTGETNYTGDGINPNTGDPATNFVFRLKYTDSDTDGPAAGYPKLYIKKGGVDISGSPFTMSYVSGEPASGAIYSYTKTLSATGSDYTYYFEAQDAYAANATGTPLTPVAGPIVSNHAPVLAWTGEANYAVDGLNPASGDRNATYVFRVKYSDADNQAPAAGYPKVYIKQGGSDISGSPFAMSYVSGANNTGAIYTYSRTLTPGAYTYAFSAQDSDLVDATGVPSGEAAGPEVSNQLPALAWTAETNYASDGVYPRSGNSADSFVFRVKYSDADNDAPVAGYPRVRIKKSGSEIPGSPFALGYVSGANNTGAVYSISKTLAAGDYSYLFEAADLYSGEASGGPLSEKTGPLVIGTSAAPPAAEVKVYHGVFKPGENEKTSVAFNLPAAAVVTVKVYDSSGRKVRDLYSGSSASGLNAMQWDGRNDGGQRVSSGVYTIKVEGGGINQTRRVVVVR